MTTWVYVRSKLGDCYTVGFYKPDGKWEAESDWPSSEKAAQHVHWLNGGKRVAEALDNLEPTTIDFEQKYVGW